MKLTEIQRIIEQMAFPTAIKCIVCEDELPVKSRFSVCKKCTLKPLTLFCDVCGRAYDSVNSQNKNILSEESEEFLPSVDFVQPIVENSEIQTEIQANLAEIQSDTYIIPTNGICKKCTARPPRFNAARAAFFYDGEVKNLIYKLKFGNARYLAAYLAEYMLDTLSAFKDTEENPPELITFVPMYYKKQRRRGYNQAELLARELANKTDIPAVDALKRTKETKNVAKMTRLQRAEAIKGSIEVKDPSAVKDKSILLIDDVFTTGITANECAKQLKATGALAVYVLTFATNHV